MSSAPDLRVSRSLELVARLKQTITEFARQEEQLMRTLRTRRQSINWKHQETLEKTEAALAAEQAGVEERFVAEENRLRGRLENRRRRIERARAEGVHDLRARARREKEKWVSELQIKHLRAERSLPRDLKALEAAFNEAVAKLGEERERFAGLLQRARRSFAGYPSFQRMLAATAKPDSTGASHPPDRLFAELQRSLALAADQLQQFRRSALTRLFSYLPLPLLIPLLLLGGVLLGGFAIIPWSYAAGTVGGLILLIVVLYLISRQRWKASAAEINHALSDARKLHDQCAVALQTTYQDDRARVQHDYERTLAEIHERWSRVDDLEADFERAVEEKIETQVPRLLARNDELLLPKLHRVEAEHAARIHDLVSGGEARKKQIQEARKTELTALAEHENARWDELAAQWRSAIEPLYETIQAMNAQTAAKFPPWKPELVEQWSPPREFTSAARFGQIDLELAAGDAALPKNPRLALPGPSRLSIPVALTFPNEGSLLYETNDSARSGAMEVINNIILRLLATTPPGKLSFTIIDPVGLGQNFSGLMHLADYEESLINRRIWTQRDQIEERLAELSEHIEKVIQMYLRNEYATITEYNQQAGSVAEKYHFLVVADFPAGFGESAAKRLQSIAVSGARCGVYTLIHWDHREALPEGFVAAELRKNSVVVRQEHGRAVVGHGESKLSQPLVFDPAPEAELAVRLVHQIGKSSIDSNRVEVPFAQIAPKPEEFWTNETTNELRIAIGRTGATKHQYLAIGKGTRQHALFAGKTGSGKSTLFHVIITNLALACSPEQVEFYLIDFKKGVEFKCYATKQLPHARVVAIESDREFALSVLQRVDEELKRRGDLFRQLGVQDIAGYKRAGGTEPIPRSLLIIDEFQEFFVEDDAVAQTASLLFDRIVRQGRAFGIHVLLGSQSLGGAYSLARATIGQMVIRVALQCNEADAYLIMDDTNSAPRLLSRPGEGIYNDAGGASEGNSPFQVVWLPDDERDRWLEKVRELAEQRHDGYPGPIVFEGNSPADIRENRLLRTLLETRPATSPAAARAWLGAPNSIKGPTELIFRRQSGNHLLIVGQRDEPALTLLGLSLLALAAQYPAGSARFIFVHAADPESAEGRFIEQLAAVAPDRLQAVRGHELEPLIDELSATLKERSADGKLAADAPAIYLFIHGLHRFKKLRHEDDFDFSGGGDGGANTGAQFSELIREGSSHGLHILVSIDTFNSVGRFMSRKVLSEFEMRVVFQMSANDSASLIDSPRASVLGLHRALLYNEHQGSIETFRPYAMPDREWMEAAREKLRAIPGAG